MSNLNRTTFQIRLKRGLAANVNATGTIVLAVEGEPYWTTDTDELYVFTGLVNKRIGVALDYGTYVPTGTAATNLDATPTGTMAQYIRVGTMVTVSGRFTADPALPATQTSFEITLPIASNISSVSNVAGTAFCGNIAGMGAEINGVVANDTAKINWVSSDTTSQAWSFMFTYQII